MRINAIQSPAFKSVYVTTSTKNNGDYVERKVIEPFKQNFQPGIEAKKECRDFETVKKDTDFYVLGAGAGSRFKELASTQGPQVNKISFALPLSEGDDKGYLHMLDIAMAMSVPFADEKGLQRKNAEVARGSFAEVYDNALKLREQGKPQKNVVVCCGDNMFHTDKPFELDYFVKDVIEDPTKQMGLIGVERDPEEVVGKFGCLKVVPTGKLDVMKLDGFVEKPGTLELARKFETPAGKCIANTGMFVIKSDAMEWLMDEIEKDPMFIAKNEKEPYDFAAACTKVQEQYGKDKCDVKLVQTWEDAGDPQALYRSIEEFQKGHFLSNFAKEDQKDIRTAMSNIYDGRRLLASKNAALEYLLSAGCNDKLLDNPNVTVTPIDGIDVIV